MAGVLFAWLNLLVQPCLAELPAVPDPAGHCEGRDAADHLTYCSTMQAVDCDKAELNAGSPQTAYWLHAGRLLVVLSPDAGSPLATEGAQLRALTTGPPLIIRYCNLRN